MSKQDFRFAFVSNSQIIAQRVLEYATACGLRMEIHLATMESAVPVARKLLDDGVDVILGGGGTGRLMRQCLRRPVITIARSHLDLLRALLEARTIASEIAITYYDAIPQGLDLFADLLQVDLRPILFTTTQELVNGITKAIKHGAGCIVGGGICVEIAKAQGCPGVVCLPGEDNLQRAMEEAINIAESTKHEHTGSSGFIARYTLADILGESPSMQELRQKAALFAQSDAALLIQGETGTGKELMAHAVHCASKRKHRPFVAINCAALPENLLESELFGYEEGAFTGARRGGKNGLFVMAHGGSVLLDEIGDISPRLQIRLLRVLETREVLRVGGNALVPVDIRIISASLKDLAEEVRQGRFRADLYYRLSCLRLYCPPLRERLEDMDLLCKHILQKLGGHRHKLSPNMLHSLLSYSWRGNIRELEAFLRRYLLLLIDYNPDPHLFHALFKELVHESPFQKRVNDHHRQEEDSYFDMIHNTDIEIKPLKIQCEQFEQRYIHKVLRITNGNRNKAAQLLGISTNTLWRKMK